MNGNDIAATRGLLVDAFGRVRELVQDLTDGLDLDAATYRPEPEANSIGWLIWHLARIQDDHIADLAGVEQAWPTWRAEFGLPFDDYATGYGQTSAEAGAVRVDGELLGRYHSAVHAMTRAYLDGLTLDELDRVVDTRWDPPVTASVRLVSVLGDTLQHLGQAAYVRGLLDRHDRAWRTPGVAER